MFESATWDLPSTDTAVGTLLLAPQQQEVYQLLPCRVEDPELWFAEQAQEVERAKRLCQGCPMQLACLQGAIQRGEPWGVWGGEVFDHGRVVQTKRGRGRPRKVTLVG